MSSRSRCWQMYGRVGRFTDSQTGGQTSRQSLVLLKLIPYFCATIKSTIFVIYFDTLGFRDMQLRNQSVLAIWMWVTMKSFQITFCGSLVLLKLIPYFCATIKPTIYVIYFDTLGVQDMQFQNQSVLAIWMWVTMKSF